MVLRRQTWASRLDFGSAWVVAFLAGILYLYQAVSRIQVADVVQSSGKARSALTGFGVGSMLIILGLQLFRSRSGLVTRKVAVVITFSFSVLAISLFGAWLGFYALKFFALGLSFSVFPGILFFIYFTRRGPWPKSTIVTS